MDELQSVSTSGESRQTTPLRQAPQRASMNKILPAVLVLVIIAAGIFSGLILSSRSKSAQSTTAISSDQKDISPEIQQSFAQTFKDDAEGTIEKDATREKYSQGTHKLIRSGGESQTAYLMSTVLDLDQYVGKKVKVYGETFGSTQVGWLMDVGKVEEIK